MSNRLCIAICGATGFIGHNLVEFFSLSGQYRIKAFYHTSQIYPTCSDVEWYQCDFLDPSSVKNIFQDVDIVLQFAAVTSGAKDIIERPYLHVTDNAIMNSLLIKEAALSPVQHFIFPSCSIVYPSSAAPQKESSIDYSSIHPVYFGAAHTKLYIESQLQFFASINSFKASVIRHSNIYGPYDKFDSISGHVLSSAISKITNSNAEVNIWGDGASQRDFLYISDFLEFIQLLLDYDGPVFNVFNCASSSLCSINELYSLIASLSANNCQFVHDLSQPSFNYSVMLDTEKSKNVLGWSPKTALPDGLSQTMAWYIDLI